MKLARFRVTKFRSVKDSGWIEAGDVTSLIGTNESGKTNVLVPLWKLNPAKDGEINPIADYPRTEYNAIRAMSKEDKPIFIRAEFALTPTILEKVSRLAPTIDPALMEVVCVSRDFAGEYFYDFPKFTSCTAIPKQELIVALHAIRNSIDSAPVAQDMGQVHKTTSLGTLDRMLANANALSDAVSLDELNPIKATLDTLAERGTQADELLSVISRAISDHVGPLHLRLTAPDPALVDSIQEIIRAALPIFVYYSTYGNLDSEIYLPHVIENLQRTDLGTREEAKARTLRVLFDFVRLNAKEILELGKDIDETKAKASLEAIQQSATRKKEREILLQSAGTALTESFRHWWKQGAYRIRFQADGAHFRIWVSDDIRPEEIELEGRSTGLQWFLSFYLIFLVEAQSAHKQAILLLDEPGLSLHPVAQKDLSKFFENLTQTNQLIFTTHSPFLIDSDHLDRVRAVYVDEEGKTAVSPDLRASQTGPQSKSVYSVHAALGLTVSDTLLQGCRPIIVEGISDQILLSAIKNLLVANGKLKPQKEMLFLPSGGVSGVKAVVSIVTGKDEELPFVLLDADKQGREMAEKLRGGLYASVKERVLSIADCIAMVDAELEDLTDAARMAPIIDRYLKGPDDYPFAEATTSGAPIVPQIKEYAARHGIVLLDGWKVELARAIKARLLRRDAGIVFAADLPAWEKLFDLLNA